MRYTTETISVKIDSFSDWHAIAQGEKMEGLVLKKMLEEVRPLFEQYARTISLPKKMCISWKIRRYAPC